MRCRPSVAPVRLDISEAGVFEQVNERAPRLPPGWALKYLLVGFPLWWALGLNTLAFPLFAVPMAIELWRRGPVRLPSGMWLWSLFLLWQVLSMAMFAESPPSTHEGSLSGRVIGVIFSAVEYAGVTITLLYVVNLRRDLVPQAAIARWMGTFFLTVAAGGFLGSIKPSFGFTSGMEYLLPDKISSNAFVQALVHPVAAQVQNVIGVSNGRPSAPFGYTNTWGNALSILVVWFVAAWVLPSRGWQRMALWAAVAVTVVPVVLSLNRGLWVGIAFTAVWLLGRLVTQRELGRVVAIGAVLVTAGTLFVVSPLLTVVTERLNAGVSDNIRSFVADKSVIAVEHSPVLGYAGPRKADGSNSSIAIGPTPECANCGEVATGSTGQLWSVLFNNGVVGSVFYFGFFLFALWRYRRLRGPIAEAALVTIALGFVYMLFYSALPVAPTLTMVAVGVLWREFDAGRTRAASGAGDA